MDLLLVNMMWVDFYLLPLFFSHVLVLVQTRLFLEACVVLHVNRVHYQVFEEPQGARS